METGERLANCPFSVVRSDGRQEQAKTARLSNVSDASEHFTITQDRTTNIRWEGGEVQVSAFITRERRRAEYQSNGEHEAV